MIAIVSICIPTYNRPTLVREAVQSALDQTYSSIDIVVCDDSPDNRTELCLADLITLGKIRYERNTPALKQAKNVNRLFDLARGDFLVLLHDDDVLLPDAVSQLVDCFNANANITAAFGKQYLISQDGKIDEAGSEALNASYERSAANAGQQTSTLKSALTAQFPNDGYMVRTAVARAVKYRDDPEVGDACDFDFGLRLAAVAQGFYFLDRYAAKYRLTDTSVSTYNNYTNLTFDLLANAKVPADLEPIRQQQMRKFASPAVNRWLALGKRRSAFRVYASSAYGWRRRLSLQGLTQAILLLCPTKLGQRIISTLRKLRRHR